MEVTPPSAGSYYISFLGGNGYDEIADRINIEVADGTFCEGVTGPGDHGTLGTCAGNGACVDRVDVSKYGTTCAELAAWCELDEASWDGPTQTNAGACPATCGTCIEEKRRAGRPVSLAHAATCSTTCADGAAIPMSCWNGALASAAGCCAPRNTRIT